MNGKAPLHQDYTKQKAQTQNEGHSSVIKEPAAVAVMDHRLAAVHEERGNEQHSSYAQSQKLIEFRARKSQQVDTHDHQSTEHERIRDQEQPQTETVCSSL